MLRSPPCCPSPSCPLAQIYVAYELGTYFQNFRRYVRSYDPTRMHDGSSSGSPVAACNPFSFLGDNGSLPINPCGQIAQSFFNDTFTFAVAGSGQLEVDSSSIAWSSDADNLYGAVPAENYNPGGTSAPLRGGNTSEVVLNANQHWMVRACGRRGGMMGSAGWPLHCRASVWPQLLAAHCTVRCCTSCLCWGTHQMALLRTLATRRRGCGRTARWQRRSSGA